MLISINIRNGRKSCKEREIMSKCIGKKRRNYEERKSAKNCKWRSWGGIKEHEENYRKKKWRSRAYKKR